MEILCEILEERINENYVKQYKVNKAKVIEALIVERIHYFRNMRTNFLKQKLFFIDSDFGTTRIIEL